MVFYIIYINDTQSNIKCTTIVSCYKQHCTVSLAQVMVHTTPC